MKLTANNGVVWLLLVLVFTPLCVVLIPLSATVGVIFAIGVLISGLLYQLSKKKTVANK